MGYERSLRRQVKYNKHIALLQTLDLSERIKQLAAPNPKTFTYEQRQERKAMRLNEEKVLNGPDCAERRELIRDNCDCECENNEYRFLKSQELRRAKLLNHYIRHYDWSRKRFSSQ